jgi:cytochrome c-type biogenesis protein CcmH
MTLQGETVPRLASFAEATVMANNGVVTDTARKAFQRILEIDPQRTEAAFGLALAKEQDGDLASALADYRQMLSRAPDDANWKQPLEERIKALEGRMTGKPTPAAPQAAAPSANAAQRTSPEDLAKMSPADREKFITSMVEGLASRLKTDGKDLPGWLRLIRAYAVLGREDDANAAMAEARRNFDGDANALGEIDALAKSLKQGS